MDANQKLSFSLNLDNILVGDERWETSIGQLIRDEINDEIKKTVREGIRSDVTLARAIKKLTDGAIDAVTMAYLKLEEE